MIATKSITAAAKGIATINVVDGDASSRSALSSLFQAAGWRVQAFESGREFLAGPRVLAPGCLIMDVTLPDIDGLELQHQVADRPELPVIFLTRDMDVLTTVRAMKAGALEFLTKPVENDFLVDVVRSAIDHSCESIAHEAELQALRKRHAALSRREREVMSLVVAGYLNKQVGAELEISEITVKAHRGRAMRKMQAYSLAHLISMAAALRAAGVSQLQVATARRPSLSRAFDFGGVLTVQHAARL